MNVKLIAIAALGKSRQIGLQDGLPWDIPEEYEHFRKTVRDHYVIIGRRNFELHGGKVEGAYPLLITRNPSRVKSDAPAFESIEAALDFLEGKKVEVAYVIGGAEIYRLALPHVDEFLWTEVDYDGPADTYFPEFLQLDWKILEEQHHSGWSLRRLKRRSLSRP